MSMSELWEVLVPQTFNDGAEVPVQHHRSWDERVRNIVGGLTIFKSVRGIWVSPAGEIFREGMIPVRVACTREQIEMIIDLTISHYRQDAVMAYKISEQVIIRHRT